MGSYNSTSKIILEGNIGAGKSTLLKIIQDNFQDITVFEEPVKLWQKTGIFDKYYKDQKRWGFTFQVNALATRLINASNANEIFKNCSQNIVIERSGIADRAVFMNVMSKYQELDDVELKIYDTWYNTLMEKFDVYDMDTKFIYLRTSPKICNERIIKRNRETEKDSVSMNYLTELHNAHEKKLIPLINEITDDLLIVDGDKNYIENKEELNELLDKIQEFASYTYQ